MLGINWFRDYGQDGEHAAARPARIDRSLGVRVDTSTGRLVRSDGSRLRLCGTTMQESGTMLSDAQRVSHIKRIRGNGYNAVRLLASNSGKKWTNYSGASWGPHVYDETDTAQWATVSNRWLLSEAALVQVDKTVAGLFDAGIEFILISNNNYASHIERHASQHARGTHMGYGMHWSSEYRAIMKESFARYFTRVNTITGERYCDNRRIGWQLDNENGMADSYMRSTTSAWGGSASMHWWDKLVEGITDSYGDNGYWYAELNAKLAAWAASADGIAAHASAGGSGVWTVPLWGRGSTGVADGARGFPKRSVWSAWATGAAPERDRDMIVMYVDAMEVEYQVEMIEWLRGLTATGELVYCPATFHYQTPRATLQLPDIAGVSILAERHIYYPSAAGVGVSLGSCVTRKSVMDATSNYGLNGGQLYDTNGVRSRRVALMCNEQGDYGPNRWRYQRLYYSMLSSLLGDYETFGFSEGQQITATQLLTDGRYMAADHANCASPAWTLAARATSVAQSNGFLSPLAGEYTFNSTKESFRAYQKAANAARIAPAGYVLMGGAPYTLYAGLGYGYAAWAKRVYWSFDEGAAATSEAAIAADFPSLSPAALDSGTMLVNTAAEKVYAKRPEGVQLMTPYMCGFIDTLRAKPAADAIFAMPLSLSDMVAPVNCAVCFLRSDGPWPLFTGPMKLYIHGSDFSDEVVSQGSDYAQHAADALGAHDPPGAAYFMANDLVTVYYSGAASQSWGNATGSAASVRLMMPEAFTLSLDTSGVGGTDLEIFGITKDGLPVRLPSTYDSGTKVWSFAYNGTYPEYTVQPAVSRSTSAVGRVLAAGRK